jgi:L-gulonolactone oxidase
MTRSKDQNRGKAPLPDVGRHCIQTNFGGNLGWAARCYQPKTEDEVLEILERHRHGHIRVVGARHSWSDIAVCDDVSLDMSRLNSVQVPVPGGERVVRVGGGCTLQRLLEELHTKSDQTLPTMGVIKRQTLSGAISTGTHGSGTRSLSHFVVHVRVAGYDSATGKPRIYEHAGGDELRASRCGLGCTGVILSVDLQTVPQYMVEETVRIRRSLDEVLDGCKEFPLSQFIYVPFQWYFVVFERTRFHGRLGFTWPLKVDLFRLFNVLFVDFGSHLGVKVCVWLGKWWVRRLLCTVRLLYWPVTNRKRVDLAERVLTMEHDLFQHEEMEIFVTATRLKEAIAFLRGATEAFAGDEITSETKAILNAAGFDATLRGSYLHHYPFSIRRVLPEDTLLSMTSGAREPMYSISVFSYHWPRGRGSYYTFCAWLARAMTRLYDARLHWGKHFPQTVGDVTRLYPGLPAFKQVCGAVDPHGVFHNAYTQRVLGMPPAQPCVSPK